MIWSSRLIIGHPSKLGPPSKASIIHSMQSTHFCWFAILLGSGECSTTFFTCLATSTFSNSTSQHTLPFNFIINLFVSQKLCENWSIINQRIFIWNQEYLVQSQSIQFLNECTMYFNSSESKWNMPGTRQDRTTCAPG